jgi:pimeloyl-ACP methyl ester carboxylesterase
VQPTLAAIEPIADHREAWSPPWSSTIRTARSRTSGENRFDVFFVIRPSSQAEWPPPNPGRFKSLLLLRGARRFYLVGHDWGGSLAWEIAARHPERLGSLTMLSRPHLGAFARALREDPGQPHRSRHHRASLDPGAAAALLAEDAR